MVSRMDTVVLYVYIILMEIFLTTPTTTTFLTCLTGSGTWATTLQGARGRQRRSQARMGLMRTSATYAIRQMQATVTIFPTFGFPPTLQG